MNVTIFLLIFVLPVTLQASSVNSQTCSASGVTITQATGFITSPGWPSSYSNSDTCVWTIKTATGTVFIKVLTFNTENNYDYLRVYDGPTIHSSLIASLTGISAAGSSYSSTGNSLTLKFTTDDSTTRSGFRIMYTVPNATCPQFGYELRSGPGIIQSSNWPDFYNSNESCTWYLITPHPNIRIDLNISRFHTEKNKDFLYIYEGNSSDSSTSPKLISALSGEICGTKAIKINRSLVTLTFATDWVNDDSGFSLEYKFITVSAVDVKLVGFDARQVAVWWTYPGQTLTQDQSTLDKYNYYNTSSISASVFTRKYSDCEFSIKKLYTKMEDGHKCRNNERDVTQVKSIYYEGADGSGLRLSPQFFPSSYMYIITGLQPHTMYNITLRGYYNASLWINTTSTVSTSQAAPENPPTNIQFALDKSTSDSITFTFSSTPCDERGGEGFKYEYDLMGADSWVRQYSRRGEVTARPSGGGDENTTSPMQVTITGLLMFTRYRIRLRAANSKGTSAWSDTAVFGQTTTSESNSYPLLDTVEMADITDTSLRIAWKVLPSARVIIRKYLININAIGHTCLVQTKTKLNTSSYLTQVVDAGVRQTTFTGLHPCAEYTVNVLANTVMLEYVTAYHTVNMYTAQPDIDIDAIELVIINVHLSTIEILLRFHNVDRDTSEKHCEIIIDRVKDGNSKIPDSNLDDDYKHGRHYIAGRMGVLSTANSSLQFTVGDDIVHGGHHNPPLSMGNYYYITAKLITQYKQSLKSVNKSISSPIQAGGTFVRSTKTGSIEFSVDAASRNLSQTRSDLSVSAPVIVLASLLSLVLLISILVATTWFCKYKRLASRDQDLNSLTSPSSGRRTWGVVRGGPAMRLGSATDEFGGDNKCSVTYSPATRNEDSAVEIGN